MIEEGLAGEGQDSCHGAWRGTGCWLLACEHDGAMLLRCQLLQQLPHALHHLIPKAKA